MSMKTSELRSIIAASRRRAKARAEGRLDPRAHWKSSPETYAECYLREAFPRAFENALRYRWVEMAIHVKQDGITSEFSRAAADTIATRLRTARLDVTQPQADASGHYVIVRLKRRR